MIARGVYVKLNALGGFDWFRLGLLLGAAGWGVLAVLAAVGGFAAPETFKFNGEASASPLAAAIGAFVITAIFGSAATIVSSAVAAVILKLISPWIAFGGLGVAVEDLDDPTGEVIRR